MKHYGFLNAGALDGFVFLTTICGRIFSNLTHFICVE